MRHRKVRFVKRPLWGLFHCKKAMFGNRISFSEKKSRRVWYPNIQIKSLWSDLLGLNIRMHISTKALKTVDKKGGLDNYLLFTRNKYIDSDAGKKLKKMIISAWEKKEGTKFKPKKLLLEDKINETGKYCYISRGFSKIAKTLQKTGEIPGIYQRSIAKAATSIEKTEENIPVSSIS